MGKLNSIAQGFFIPFFFIVVGSGFDPKSAFLGASPFLFLSILLLALFIKLFPSLLVRLRGFSLKEALGLGFLLSAPLTLMVAIAEIGFQLGLLERSQHSALILLAIISGLVYPIFASRLLKEES